MRLLSRRSLTILFFAAGLSALAAACGPLFGPTFVNHPAPDIESDFSLFEEVGCPLERGRLLQCDSDSPMWAVGCPQISQPSARLGALQPGYPLMLCVFSPHRDEDFSRSEFGHLWQEGVHIKRTGGLDPLFYRYVTYQEGAFVVLDTPEAFRQAYAPIESPEEALSYALALTDTETLYGLAYDPDLEYFVDELEDTHVDAVTGGYEVHLYRYSEFGCGPHPTSLVLVRVSEDGTLEELSRTQVYKNPDDDDLCMD